MMEDLIKAYEDRGVKFWVENGQLKFKAPSGTLNAEDKVKLRNVKEKLIEYYERKDKSALKADLSKRYEPFPLTGIQSAYLLGRNHNYEYSIRLLLTKTEQIAYPNRNRNFHPNGKSRRTNKYHYRRNSRKLKNLSYEF